MSPRERLIPYGYGSSEAIRFGRGDSLTGAIGGSGATPLVNDSALSWPDSPMTVTTGGTYTGLAIDATEGTSCITMDTTSAVIFQDCDFRFSGAPGVYARYQDFDIEFRNCRFFGKTPSAAGDSYGRAIDFQSGVRLIVEHCYLQNNGGIYIYNLEEVAGMECKIRYNLARNMDGRLSDGSGGWRTDAPEDTYTDDQLFTRRQFVQINNNGAPDVSQQVEISWNEVWNTYNESWPEDVINLYRVGSSDAAKPIWIHHNMIAYAARIPATSTKAYSGGGIMAQDGGEASSNILVEHNTILETHNYGIAIAAGVGIEVRDNLVLRSGFTPSGDAMVTRDNGIYCRDIGTTPGWGSHVIANNDVGWQMSDGSFKNIWNDGGATLTGNTTRSTTVDQAIIEAAIASYRDARNTAGVTVGLV